MVLVQDGAMATSNEDRLRSSILYNYDKGDHPENDVVLAYEIVYTSCPVPDPATGLLISRISEKQVRLS